MKNRIKNRVLDFAGRIAYVVEQFQLSEEEMRNQRIAESQEKIGPYVHHTCPVQIWA